MTRDSETERLYEERMVRQLPIIGEEGQKKVKSTKIGIVGCGGNGSVIALLCALIGFIHITLFDRDRLEIHNLNRFALGGVRDVGQFKVTVVKRELEKRFPEAKIQAFTKNIMSPGMWEKARQCRWLVSAVDNDETRHFLSRKCAEDGVPMVDVASGFIMRDGRLIGAGSRVNRVGPSDPCLETQILDDRPMEQAHASLAVLNLAVAALALHVLLDELTGYTSRSTAQEQRHGNVMGHGGTVSSVNKNFLMFDLVNLTIVSERIIPTPGCRWCEKLNSARE